MEKKKNTAASVRAKLKTKAAEKGVEFQNLLVRFGNERLLYRLSRSAYQKSFLLKGAALFAVWMGEPHRPTQDMDLLAFGESDIPTLENIFREICAIAGEDGLEFSLDSIKGAEIRAEKIYQGVRIKLLAFLDGARIPLQVDIGFGDAVTPEAETETIETILDLPKPKLKIYPKETVIAEKFEAMVKLGIGNSRMKDFWDVQFLIKEFYLMVTGVLMQVMQLQLIVLRSSARRVKFHLPFFSTSCCILQNKGLQLPLVLSRYIMFNNLSSKR